MPVINAQVVKNPAPAQLLLTTLNGSTDTFTVNPATLQALLLVNTTASPITVTMIGDDAPATHKCNGFQTETVTPLSVTVTANNTFTVYVNTFANVLAGVTTISGGTGLTAALINLT